MPVLSLKKKKIISSFTKLIAPHNIRICSVRVWVRSNINEAIRKTRINTLSLSYRTQHFPRFSHALTGILSLPRKITEFLPIDIFASQYMSLITLAKTLVGFSKWKHSLYVSKVWHTLAFKCLLGSIIYTALSLNCKSLKKTISQRNCKSRCWKRY